MDENDLTYFLNYKMKTMQLAFQSLQEYIDRKISEKRKLLSFQLIEGINERQALIINWIYEEPDLLLNVKEIENRFNISFQTANNDLKGLVNKGYLSIVPLNNQKRGFFKSDQFDNLVFKVIRK